MVALHLVSLFAAGKDSYTRCLSPGVSRVSALDGTGWTSDVATVNSLRTVETVMRP